MLARSTRRRELAALAALTLAAFALPWRSMGPVAVWLGPPVLFAYLVVMPGVAMTRILGVRPRDPLEAIALVPLLGFAAALAGCFLWALWKLPIDAFRFGYPAVVVFLVLATPPPGDGHRPPLDRDRIGTAAGRAMAVLAAFLGVVAVAVWIAGPPTHYQADTIDHAAYVNEVARTGQAFPHTAFYKDPGANGADLRKSLMHAFMGVFVRHLGIDAIALFAFLAGAQLLILNLTAYTATRHMANGSRAVAIAATALFALSFDGGVGSKVVRMMFYPNRFGMAPMLMFIAAAMGHLRRPTRRALVLCGVFGFLAAAVHVQYMVFTAIAAAVIVVWKACSPCDAWGMHLRRSLAAATAAGVAILPYAVYRVMTGYQTNALHTEVQGAMFVGGGLFVVDPYIVWDGMRWLGLGALVAVVPLWRHRRVAAVGFPIAALCSVLLIILNPFALPVAFHTLTYLVARLGRITPTYMIGGVLIAGALGLDRRFTGGGHRWWRRVAVTLTFFSLLLGAARVVQNRHVILANSEHERRVSLERWEHDIRAVTEGLPAGSVIASDPVTSYYVSAVTPYYVLCTLDQHAPPNDRLARARVAAARDIFSPYTSPAEKARVMDEWGVDYVLVNEDLPRGLLVKYWSLDPDRAKEARRTFRDLDGTFVRVAASGSLTLFRRTDVPVRQVGTEVPIVPSPPSGARTINRVSGEATLVAARFDKTRVKRGGRLHIDLYWSRHEPARIGTYVVNIRFDHAGPVAPFGKIGRKIKERLDGVLYRYRTAHIIQRGFYGPDVWPSDAIVIDSTTVRIPTTLAPGPYTVQARLVRQAPMPNTDLRSYFSDHDIYAGVEIGRIEIERPASK